MPSPLLEVRVSDQGFGFEFAHRKSKVASIGAKAPRRGLFEAEDWGDCRECWRPKPALPDLPQSQLLRVWPDYHSLTQKGRRPEPNPEVHARIG